MQSKSKLWLSSAYGLIQAPVHTSLRGQAHAPLSRALLEILPYPYLIIKASLKNVQVGMLRSWP
jgi:hypothetical protein